jgi:taurine transport system substrate-binding protein
MSWKAWSVGLLVGVAVVAGMPGGDPWAQGKPDQVTIGYQVIPNAEIIGKQLGWFEKEMGVKINWKQFDSGRDVNTAILAGSLDIGLVGTSPGAAGIANGIPYEVIWIHDLEGENEALVVKKDKGLKSVKDLVGKKVAAPFGSTTHYSLLGAFKVFGVDPAKVKILDMQTPDMLAAWQRGDIDAGYVWEPTLKKMVDAGGEIILTSREMAKKGYLTGDVAVARKAFTEKYPDLVMKYLQVQARGVDLWTKSPKEAAAAVAKAFNIPADEAEREMKTLVWVGGQDQLKDDYLGTAKKKGKFAKVLKETADFLVTQKTIKSAPGLEAFQKAVNPSYLEKAVK